MEHQEESLFRRVFPRHTADHAGIVDTEVSPRTCHAATKPTTPSLPHTDTRRIFYWFGAHFDFPLLIQASVMIVVQIVMLHVALQNRPPVGAQHSLNQPFSEANQGGIMVNRPLNFWQWRSRNPYWQFLAYYTVVLAILQFLLGSRPSYVAIQGYVALGIEAVLPIPQILENRRIQSCKGFRLSVLVNWLIGDLFKMTYFFLSEGGIPWAFKLCGLFQAGCDCYLGIQYWMYGDGSRRSGDESKSSIRVA